MFTVDDYDQALGLSLPLRPHLETSSRSMLDAVLHSIAIELARIDAKADKVLDEADPRTSFDLLDHWFTDWSIPSACLTALSDPTLEEKRRELIAKILSGAV